MSRRKDLITTIVIHKMNSNVLRTLGSSRLAMRLPHPRHLISHFDIWMALLMIYLPPLYYYRNNGSILITTSACVLGFLLIALPTILVELLIGSFSGGNLVRAYDFNCLGRIMPIIILLHQFQTILGGVSNAHKVMAFSITFFLQNMNPHATLWNCENLWNTDNCCRLNKTALSRESCSTPMEEFFKHYGRLMMNGLYQPSFSTYDGGLVSLASWLIISACVLVIAQLTLRDGIRCVTFFVTIPSLLLLIPQFLSAYSQPMTNEKVSNLLTRPLDFEAEYLFQFFLPNVFHANQMMLAGGYLTVLHCCRKPHKTDRQLKNVLFKNLIFVAMCMIAFKATLCVLRHGVIGGSIELRRLVSGAMTRDKYRDIFEDSMDWIYMAVFEAIEAAYVIRQEFNYKGSMMILEGAAMLNANLLALGFVVIRIAIYKATWELVFQSVGFSELMYGPWQGLMRICMPLCVLVLNFVFDNELCRDLLFPKEPYGYAFCSGLVAMFLPSLITAHVRIMQGQFGYSLHWRMMQFALKYKRRFTCIAIIAGLHAFGAYIYKTRYKAEFNKVFQQNREKKKKIEYFFEYDQGVFSDPAKRVFSFSGVTANWFLHDLFLYLIGFFAVVFGLLQSGRVLRFVLNYHKALQVFNWKPLRCFKYCMEFYLAVIFARR